MKQSFQFRSAKREDVPLILQFIKELADYEKMLDEVVADEATLETWIFDKQKAEVLFVVENGIPVGFALFFHNFSTLLRHLPGGSVRKTRISRQGIWKSNIKKTGCHCRGKRMRTPRMVVSGLESAEH